MATVRYVKSPGEVKSTTKLDEVKTVEAEYDIIANAGDTEEKYQNLKTERNPNIKEHQKDKLDKTKFAIVLLCCVVSVLVVAVVSTNVVIFSVLATDGGWTGWEDWGTCSVTCGIGVTTRIRTCSNPRPSIMGHYCDGTSVQVQTCGNSSCAGPSIAFSVHNSTRNSSHPLVFQDIDYNYNNAFNVTSSAFECKQEGLYFFINTITRMKGCSGSSSSYCYFYKNDQYGTVAGIADSLENDSHPSGTNSILYYLEPGDRVYISSCKGADCIDPSSSFTGFIISSFH